MITDLENSVGDFIFANGVSLHSEYSYTDDGAERLNTRLDTTESHVYQWNHDSGQVVAIDGWTYQVDLELFNRGGYSLERRRANGSGNSELRYNDVDAGIEKTRSNGPDIIITNRFVSGKLAGKVRKISRQIPDGSICVEQTHRYSEDGTLVGIREPEGEINLVEGPSGIAVKWIYSEGKKTLEAYFSKASVFQRLDINGETWSVDQYHADNIVLRNKENVRMSIPKSKLKVIANFQSLMLP